MLKHPSAAVWDDQLYCVETARSRETAAVIQDICGGLDQEGGSGDSKAWSGQPHGNQTKVRVI